MHYARQGVRDRREPSWAKRENLPEITGDGGGGPAAMIIPGPISISPHLEPNGGSHRVDGAR